MLGFIFGLRPIELAMLVGIVGLVAYDFHRTLPSDVRKKRLRYALYGLFFLGGIVVMDMTGFPEF